MRAVEGTVIFFTIDSGGSWETACKSLKAYLPTIRQHKRIKGVIVDDLNDHRYFTDSISIQEVVEDILAPHLPELEFIVSHFDHVFRPNYAIEAARACVFIMAIRRLSPLLTQCDPKMLRQYLGAAIMQTQHRFRWQY